MSLSEAETHCDYFFSQASAGGLDGVYLLHGHGTGALKAGLRQVIARNVKGALKLSGICVLPAVAVALPVVAADFRLAETGKEQM